MSHEQFRDWQRRQREQWQASQRGRYVTRLSWSVGDVGVVGPAAEYGKSESEHVVKMLAAVGEFPLWE